jgi:HAD superfamily hydrolase (TIGR01509 family)
MHWAILFDRQRHEALRGVSRRRSLELLLAGRVYPEEQMLELMERKNHHDQALLKQVPPQALLPGVRHLREAGRAADCKMALGSASQNAREVGQRLHLASSLDALADGSSVVRPRPAPDLFVSAAGLVRVCVHECLVFEDVAAGVEAANVAGRYAVGLGPVARVGQADLGLPALSHVMLHDILHRLLPAHPRG